MISEPDDVTICEGEGAVFTCVLNSNIRSDDVQWYKDSVMVDPNGESINFLNRTNGSTTSSLLTITNARRSYAGDFWVRISSRSVCRVSLTILPSMYLCSYVCSYVCSRGVLIYRIGKISAADKAKFSISAISIFLKLYRYLYRYFAKALIG